jgi:ribonuclease P protein component
MPVPTEIASEPQLVGVPKEQGFPRAHRLLRRADFLRVQQQGKRVHMAHFVMLVMSARDSGTRLGVTVGRRVGGAVQRNRVKRVVREVFRRNRGLFPCDCDVVLVARPGADRLDYASVLGELERARASIERVVRQLRAEPKASDT